MWEVGDEGPGDELQAVTPSANPPNSKARTARSANARAALKCVARILFLLWATVSTLDAR
jgi:hypothetical protein